MNLSRINLRRVNLNGLNTLKSIGDLKFMWDYRFGIEAVESSPGSGFYLVNKMEDQGNGGFDIRQSSVRRPVLYADGLGGNGSTASYLRATPDSRLNFLHNGSPHLIFTVQQYDNPLNIDHRPQPLITGQAGTGPGIAFQTLGTNNSLNSSTINDVGTNLGNYNTGANSVPEDSTFRLIMQIYYGGGAGSIPLPTNNHKLIIANNVYTTTRNPAWGSGDPVKLFAFGFGAQLNSKTKIVGGYNLSGLSTIQIDDFIAFFITILKQDPEYAGLITI